MTMRSFGRTARITDPAQHIGLSDPEGRLRSARRPPRRVKIAAGGSVLSPKMAFLALPWYFRFVVYLMQFRAVIQ